MHELVRVLGRLVEQVPLGADAGAQAHDDRLADRVDRRVRHLREELLEVGEQRRALVGQHRERRCRCPSSRSAPRPCAPSARSGRAGPPACSRRPAGRSRSGCGERQRRRWAGRSSKCTTFSLEPVGRRAAAVATCALTSSSSTMRPALEVDQEELARLQAAEALDAPRGATSQHARLGAEHDVAVLRLQPSGRGAGRCGRASRRRRCRR